MSTSAATLQTLLVTVLVENGWIGNNLSEFGIFKTVPCGNNSTNLRYVNLVGRFYFRCIKLYRSMSELNAQVLGIVPFPALAVTGYTSALAQVLAARDIFPTIRVNTTSTTATSVPFRKTNTSDDWTRRTNAADFAHMQRSELQVEIQPVLAALERAQVFMGKCIEGLGTAYSAALASAPAPLGSIPVGPDSEYFWSQPDDQRTHWECDACIEWHPLSIRQSHRVTWMQVCLAKEDEFI